MADPKPIDHQALAAIIRYDPVEGVLYYKDGVELPAKGGGTRVTGRDEPVSVYGNGRGYSTFWFQKRNVKVHRAAFLLYHGFLPPVIDHVNGDPADNRIVNIRAATMRQNQYNKRSSNTSSSQYKGVSWVKTNQRWLAQIQDKGKVTFLGYHVTEQEAHQAYCQRAKEIHGEFYNPG